MAAVAICIMTAICVIAACGRENKTGSAASPKPAAELFIDATEKSGIRFKHQNGMSGEFYYPEIIGSGVALFDYNNDGKMDMLALQGTLLVPGKSTVGEKAECSARLYRNDLAIGADGARTLKFTDVTEASGLCTHGYGMGVAVGDFDNDGFPMCSSPTSARPINYSGTMAMERSPT
jgi:hypothetical protein